MTLPLNCFHHLFFAEAEMHALEGPQVIAKFLSFTWARRRQAVSMR